MRHQPNLFSQQPGKMKKVGQDPSRPETIRATGFWTLFHISLLSYLSCSVISYSFIVGIVGQGRDKKLTLAIDQSGTAVARPCQVNHPIFPTIGPIRAPVSPETHITGACRNFSPAAEQILNFCS